MSKNLRGVVGPLTRALVASFGLALASFVLLAQGPLTMLLGLFCFGCIVLKIRPISKGSRVWVELFAPESGIGFVSFLWLTERFGFVLFASRSLLKDRVRIRNGFGSVF